MKGAIYDLPDCLWGGREPCSRGAYPIDLASLGLAPAGAPPRLDNTAIMMHETQTVSTHLAGIPPTPPATTPRPDALPLSQHKRPPPARLPEDAESVHARHGGLFELLSWGLFLAIALAIWYHSPRRR